MIPSQSKQKKGEIGYDGFKKIKGIKIGVSTEKNGLPLSIFISPANIHDSKLYLPIIENVKIKLTVGAPITRPRLINADAAFDSKEIRNYNRGRGIKSNIPVNPRNTKKKRSVSLKDLIKIFINGDMSFRYYSVGSKVLKRSLLDMKSWSILT